MLSIIFFTFIVAPLWAQEGTGRRWHPIQTADPKPSPNQPWLELFFLSIGQGDATLIKSPTGKQVLVDTGPRRARGTLFEALKSAGISRLDLLINTHAHADHIGNSQAVLERLPVKLILDSGFPHATSTYTRLIDTIRALQVPLKRARRGRTIEIGGGAQLEILGPTDPLLRGTRSDPNSNSVILKLRFKSLAVLLAGDAEEETEMRLLQEPAQLKSTVLKVAHHGSRHATSDRFLRAVQPRYAVISAGRGNNFGHPAPETIERLERAKAIHFQTSKRGHLRLQSDGVGLRWHQSEVVRARGSIGRASVSPSLSRGEQRNMSAQVGKVNVNRATAAELKRLPGVGPKLAQRIIAARAQGPFERAEDLRRISGIGPKKVDRIRALISF
ncbi:MAG: helix-hairpin-helix domain-containing protein [Myxococcota bacterium]|nr:helix-hairpin-helix domain-containing protein [Myxococcota bacterium]